MSILHTKVKEIKDNIFEQEMDEYLEELYYTQTSSEKTKSIVFDELLKENPRLLNKFYFWYSDNSTQTINLAQTDFIKKLYSGKITIEVFEGELDMKIKSIDGKKVLDELNNINDNFVNYLLNKFTNLSLEFFGRKALSRVA